MAFGSLSFFVTYFLLAKVSADTPANCTYEEVRGTWLFFIDGGGKDKTADCSAVGDVTSKYKITLDYPDVATDEFNNKGFWTLIYNQGFEVVLHGRKYFAFSNYTGTAQNATSYCDSTLPGWSHDVLGHDWSCFYGKKTKPLSAKQSFGKHQSTPFDEALFRNDHKFIADLNGIQSSWKAVHYSHFESMTLHQIMNLMGGRNNEPFRFPATAEPSENLERQADALPTEWDWRNVNGVNYVPAVRNQAGCGSCYAFASAAMNEARLRVLSNNTIQLSFSTQDVVDCSRYSQGCDGGFPYLIGGKYAEDYGLVEDSCNPYAGVTHDHCTTPVTCKRHYSTNYQYVGGYYGACNEELMKLELVTGGPLAVSFEVYNDFLAYRGGVYHHTGLRSKFNPFQITNHAVLLVGYGVDKTSGEKFWTIKNSWGTGWGEEGFFRIRRGVNECAVESIAVRSDPIF